ncbi:MAG: hypothetical protein HZB11_02130 [Candidatus Yonathbacteria bacterium]|nr:hypothetical protein [Candidatus Yonathbacteria bacterium]
MIKTVAKADTARAREAVKIIEDIMGIFRSVKIGKRMWHATLFEKPAVIKHNGADSVPSKLIGVRIEREKIVLPEPKTSIGKRVQAFRETLEPLVIVRPMFEHAKIHCINVDLMIGTRSMLFTNQRVSLVALPLRGDLLRAVPSRKDLNKIFWLFKNNFPEFKYQA